VHHAPVFADPAILGEEVIDRKLAHLMQNKMQRRGPASNVASAWTR
jgi:hypothetical protein